MPLRASAAGRGTRKAEALPLPVWNGEADNTASVDDLAVEVRDMYCSAGSKKLFTPV